MCNYIIKYNANQDRRPSKNNFNIYIIIYINGDILLLKRRLRVQLRESREQGGVNSILLTLAPSGANPGRYPYYALCMSVLINKFIYAVIATFQKSL